MKTSRWFSLGLALLPTFAGGSSRAEPAPTPVPARCEASGENKAVIDQVDALFKSCGETEDCFQQRHDLLAGALEKHPDDLFLHVSYQSLLAYGAPKKWQAEADGLAERYRQKAEAAPGQAQWQYLAGRALRSDPVQAKSWYEKALALEPGLPGAHLGLAQAAMIEKSEGGNGAAWEHLWTFVRLCPRHAGYAARVAVRLPDGEQQKKLAAFARAQVAERTDEGVLDLYPPLWSLEFRATKADGHPALREQVAKDLVRLRGLGLPEDETMLQTLAEGYELTGDEKQASALHDEAIRRDPCSEESAVRRTEQWREANPSPTPGAPKAEMAAHNARMHAAANEWIQGCPQQLEYFIERLMATDAGNPPDIPRLPDEQVRTETREALARWDQRPSYWQMTPSLETFVARIYVERGMDLEQVPRLAAKARAAADERLAQREKERAGDEASRQRMRATHQYEIWAANEVEVKALLALGRLDEVKSRLDDLAAVLATQKPAEDADRSTRGGYQYRATQLAMLRGQLLEKQGKDLDALAAYRHAMVENPEHEDVAQSARSVWDRLGGSEPGWQELVASAAQAGAPQVADEMRGWEKRGTALPAFEMVDVQGKSWKPADLAGKTVLINFWATWCGPCQMELPHIQELADQTRGDANTLVLTVNIDDNPGIVAPFLGKKGFTFPTLLGADFATANLKELSIPRNWLVDRQGTLQLEQYGFNARQIDRWVSELKEHFTKAAQEATQDGAAPATAKSGESRR